MNRTVFCLAFVAGAVAGPVLAALPGEASTLPADRIAIDGPELEALAVAAQGDFAASGIVPASFRAHAGEGPALWRDTSSRTTPSFSELRGNRIEMGGAPNDIAGDPAPSEPGIVALMLAGLAAAGGLMHRRAQADRF